jgi:hypothetical protein
MGSVEPTQQTSTVDRSDGASTVVTVGFQPGQVIEPAANSNKSDALTRRTSSLATSQPHTASLPEIVMIRDERLWVYADR